MEILLVSLNKEANPFPVAPLGIAYIASSLKKSGHNVNAVDLCFSDNDKKLLASAVGAKEPELIGISIRNIDNLTFPKSIFYLPYIKEIVDLIKKLSAAPIIAGGSGFSISPEQILRYLDIKYGVIGEGETAIPSFADCISKKDNPYGIPNLCFIKENTFHSNKVLRDEMFHCSLPPDRNFIDNHSYLKLGGMANIQSKRGCPFKCCYCTYPNIDGGQLRIRHPSDIADEIEEIRYKYNTSHLFFVDDIFNYPQSHALGICEEIIRRDIRINWTCFATPKGMTKELSVMMKKAGCGGIEFGTDSGSEKMLAALNKSFSLCDVEKATNFCRDADLPAAHYVIIGGPGENKKTLEETFSFFDFIKPAAVIALTGIRIYPHTALCRLSKDYGIISDDADIIYPEFFISPDLGADNMLESVKRHALARQNWVVPGLDIRCSADMMTMLRKLGKQGPLWDLLAGRK